MTDSNTFHSNIKNQSMPKQNTHQGMINEESPLDFNTLFQIYLEDSKFRHRPSTYKRKCEIFNTHILPFFNTMPINTITPRTIRFWQNRLLSENPQISESYKRMIHSQLSAFFNYLVKFYGHAQNPCKLAGPIRSQKYPRMQFWTKSGFDQFISSFDKSSAYQTIFNMLFYTGTSTICN